MAARLTPIGWITKFMIVPAALAAVGYFVVGPRIGQVNGGNKPEAGSTDVSSPTPADPPSSTIASKPEGDKDQPPSGVHVTAKPETDKTPNLGQDSDANQSSGQASDDNPKPRTRPHKRTHVPSVVAPPTDPTPDDGGSTADPGQSPSNTTAPASAATSKHGP